MHSSDPTPHQITEDTFLIPDHLGESNGSLVVQLNSMVICGEQPVVVDTGAPVNRARFLDQLFGLVDPATVRWVFLSHEDIDHSGNLESVLEACPQATLATSWFAMVRLAAGGMSIPAARWRRVGDGDVIDIGDRALVVQRPPLYDSPTTYGVFDTESEVFWAADCFASGFGRPAVEAAEIPFEEWRRGFIEFHQWQSPWLEGFEVRWWNRIIDRFAARHLSAIASCHGPIVRGDQIATAIELLRELPELPIGQRLEQSTLDDLLAIVKSLAI
jgi:flavorubredoxin